MFQRQMSTERCSDGARAGSAIFPRTKHFLRALAFCGEELSSLMFTKRWARSQEVWKQFYLRSNKQGLQDRIAIQLVRTSYATRQRTLSRYRRFRCNKGWRTRSVFIDIRS